MKKMILLALSSGLMMSHFAFGQVAPMVQCSLLPPAPADYYVTVTLYHSDAPIVPGNDIEAMVSEESWDIRHFASFVNVQQLDDHHLVGAARVYQTPDKDFTLTILVDTAPVNGMIRSHVDAMVEGHRVSRDLLCKIDSL